MKIRNTFSSFQKQRRFADFSNCVQNCNLCPRMEHRNRVLSEMNGKLDSEVLFIAEAPGRLGADKTGIPLYGDKTGENFEKLIQSIGWCREDVFITNAVLCNPRDNEGNNDTPNTKEIYYCSVYLAMTIALIEPKVIVTLGRVALEALNHIFPHSLSLKANVGQFYKWKEYSIFPMYHPGPRALLHRSIEKQIEDYQVLAAVTNPVPMVEEGRTGNKFAHQIKINFGIEKDALKQVLLYFIDKLQTISFFKATKLLYLADNMAIERIGCSITGSVYLRQAEGPWIPKLKETSNQLNNIEIDLFFRNQKPFLRKKKISIDLKGFSVEMIGILEEILSTYGSMTDRGLKIAAYRTKPMQYILALEKKNAKMFNKAVIYKNKTIIEIDKANKDQQLF